jgi:hypothetical protein
LDLFRRKKAAPVYGAMIWALGRIGSRSLMYGPLNTIVPPSTAEQWVRKIIEPSNGDQAHFFNRGQAPTLTAIEQLAIMLLARKTGDRYLDIGQATREQVLEIFEAHETTSPKQQHLTMLVREVTQLDAEEQGAVFGETLPLGLRLKQSEPEA